MDSFKSGLERSWDPGVAVERVLDFLANASHDLATILFETPVILVSDAPYSF